MKRRGEEIIMAVAEAAVERMNDPKNVKKGDWKECTIIDLYDFLYDELNEFFSAGKHTSLSEAGDVLAFLAMICDKLGVIEKKGDSDEY